MFVFSCGNLYAVSVYEKNNGTFSFNFQSQRPRRGLLGQRQQVVPGAGAQGQRQWHVSRSLRRISRKVRPPGGSAAGTDEEQCEGRRRCKPEQTLDGKKQRTRKRRPWWDPAFVGEGVSSSSRSVVSSCPHFQFSNTRSPSALRCLCKAGKTGTDEEQCEGRRRCKPEQTLDGKKQRTRKRRPWWDPAFVGEGVSSSSRSVVSSCPHFQFSNTRTSSPRSTSLRRVLGKRPASQSR